jgi:DNA-binding transcriptional LysR family regulator
VAVDLRHFRSFVVVAEEGNIGRAATRLFITQPALSRQLQHLEEELGVALLVRVPRGVELPEAGRELPDKARAALDAAERALTIGKAVEPAGRLAVGVSIAGHRDHWLELGEAFTACYPRVEVEIHTASAGSVMGLRQMHLLERKRSSRARVNRCAERQVVLFADWQVAQVRT